MNLVVSLLTQIHPGRITEALTVNLPAFLLSKSNNPDPVRALRFLEAFSSYRVQIAFGFAASSSCPASL
jgi:hypothetical protein